MLLLSYLYLYLYIICICVSNCFYICDTNVCFWLSARFLPFHCTCSSFPICIYICICICIFALFTFLFLNKVKWLWFSWKNWQLYFCRSNVLDCLGWWLDVWMVCLLRGWMIYQVESSFMACHTYTGVILSHNEAFWVILTAHSLDRYHEGG